MSSVKLSIIVPVYGVEKYLQHCLDSILQQTFQDFEIILVDDGSKDNSGKICDDYAAQDTRIKVIHQENAGLAMARNSGLTVAVGLYVAFVDSDDWLEPDMYEMLFSDIEQNMADIALCGYVNDYGTGKKYDVSTKKDILVLDSEKAIEIMLKGKPFGAYAWNKVFKRALLEELRFPNVRFAEDVFFTWNLFHRASKITYNSSAKYHYRQRPESLCSAAFNLNKLSEIEVRKLTYQSTALHYPQLVELAFARYMQCVIQIGTTLASLDEYKGEFLKLRQLISDNAKSIKQSTVLQKRFKKHMFLLTMPYSICHKFYFARMCNRKVTDYVINKFK